MSWNIVLFSSGQNLVSLENLNEDLLKPIDFDKVLKLRFTNIKKTENHNEVIGKDFSIDFFDDEELISNKMLICMAKMDCLKLSKLQRKKIGKFMIVELTKC